MPPAKEKAYRLACAIYRGACGRYEDPDHPKRDKAHCRAVALMNDCRDAARAADGRARDT